MGHDAALRDRLWHRTRHEPWLWVGIVLSLVGMALLGYALTEGVFGLVPTIEGVSRLGRWLMFAGGMLVFSLGVALTAAVLVPDRGEPQ